MTTGIQTVADDHDSQKGKAQADILQEWAILFPVKVKEYTHDCKVCLQKQINCCNMTMPEQVKKSHPRWDLFIVISPNAHE